MVGTRRLELLTSTVSISPVLVLSTTYRSLETAKEPARTSKSDFQQVILQARKCLGSKMCRSAHERRQPRTTPSTGRPQQPSVCPHWNGLHISSWQPGKFSLFRFHFPSNTL